MSTGWGFKETLFSHIRGKVVTSVSVINGQGVTSNFGRLKKTVGFVSVMFMHGRFPWSSVTSRNTLVN